MAKTESEKKSLKKWKLANPEKVKAANKKWRDGNKERLKAARIAWKLENPDKVKEHNNAWKLKNPEKVKAMRKKDNMINRARKSRTPEGFEKILERLKWAVVQDFTGGWIRAPWVADALSFFPYAACCEWMEKQGVGVKVLEGTTLELRFDKRFDISGDFALIRCGYKRVRNLEGLVTFLGFAGLPVPEAWAEIDTSPLTYEWADCLRNVLGHDLTRIKTVVGAKNKRFPCAMNLAMIETWLDDNELAGELRVEGSLDDNERAWVKIMIKDEVLWKVRILGSGGIEPGAIEAAVDVLKKLPLKRWNNSDYEVPDDVVDPYMAFDPMSYKGMTFPLDLDGVIAGARRYSRHDAEAQREAWSLINCGYIVKRAEDGLYVPSGRDKNWNHGYMEPL